VTESLIASDFRFARHHLTVQCRNHAALCQNDESTGRLTFQPRLKALETVKSYETNARAEENKEGEPQLQPYRIARAERQTMNYEPTTTNHERQNVERYFISGLVAFAGSLLQF